MDESSLSPAARRALEVFGEQTAAPLGQTQKDALWRTTVAAAEPKRDRWALKAFVLCLSAVVGAVVVTRLMQARRPEVQVLAAAQWQRAGDHVTVQQGRLRLQPRVELAVVTPQLQAVVHNAVALFDVSADATTLAVESGEVAWRSKRNSGVVTQGQRTTVRSAPSPTLAIAPGAPSVDSCAQGTGYERCLSREAEGSGLAAQTALYALGMLAHEQAALAEAIALFRSYGERFPSGVFAPEASIALMVDLKEVGKSGEARAEAARFSSRFSDEPRAEDVARWAEQIR